MEDAPRSIRDVQPVPSAGYFHHIMSFRRPRDYDTFVQQYINQNEFKPEDLQMFISRHDDLQFAPNSVAKRSFPSRSHPPPAQPMSDVLARSFYDLKNKITNLESNYYLNAIALFCSYNPLPGQLHNSHSSLPPMSEHQIPVVTWDGDRWTAWFSFLREVVIASDMLGQVIPDSHRQARLGENPNEAVDRTTVLDSSIHREPPSRPANPLISSCLSYTSDRRSQEDCIRVVKWIPYVLNHLNRSADLDHLQTTPPSEVVVGSIPDNPAIYYTDQTDLLTTHGAEKINTIELNGRMYSIYRLPIDRLT